MAINGLRLEKEHRSDVSKAALEKDLPETPLGSSILYRAVQEGPSIGPPSRLKKRKFQVFPRIYIYFPRIYIYFPRRIYYKMFGEICLTFN